MKKNQTQTANSSVGAVVSEKFQKSTLLVVKPEETAESLPEIKTQAIKPALNLEATIKIVEELHMKKRHRDRLEHSIDELDKFVIKRQSEDLDDKSYYQGCMIKVSDDDRNEWSTKNPTVITEVVNFLKAKFQEKLSEIEAQIILPI